MTLEDLLLIMLCYVMFFIELQLKCSSISSFIDYSEFDGSQFICSGSEDKTVRVWDVETSKQIESFNGHSSEVYYDKTIRFWDFKNNQQLKIFNGHNHWVNGIKFSPFNGGRYLCSGSGDSTIRLWDVETSKALHIFNGHKDCVWCVDISPLQSSNNNNNNNNSIGVIGGNGYTICSGSYDTTIVIWDIETTKQLISFIGHVGSLRSVKYGSNEIGNIGCANTILSGSGDNNVRLWDIRSGKKIQKFEGHDDRVMAVEYSPFVVNNGKFGDNSNVICSGSEDNTIRFWDIRSNRNELYSIEGDNNEDQGILSFTFFPLQKDKKAHDNIKNSRGFNLCYGSGKGSIRIWG
ncbi:hypothetical protein RFI_21312 [Reticulomyxa filosa]|uniref:G-protein beta WD-40 repeats containing protein n=1 Tax=Reticulomyxa filosa TaxID=46433 RepID=X6MQW7_RETFI|nr:hypothetical protein RFI_21312 [Reticulomyxa filosa]|eukprot:ETO16051.1 hypothetical protein RFI_21312 [Reticulomyxa filosa]